LHILVKHLIYVALQWLKGVMDAAVAEDASSRTDGLEAAQQARPEPLLGGTQQGDEGITDALNVAAAAGADAEAPAARGADGEGFGARPPLLSGAQEEVLVALRAVVNRMVIDDAEDAEDAFVVAAKAFLDLDLASLPSSEKALSAALPLFDAFLDACRAQAVLSDGTATKFAGEVHDAEMEVHGLVELVAVLRARPGLTGAPPPLLPPPSALSLGEGDTKQLISHLQAQFPSLMKEVGRRTKLDEVPGARLFALSSRSPLLSQGPDGPHGHAHRLHGRNGPGDHDCAQVLDDLEEEGDPVVAAQERCASLELDCALNLF
jgi:hypothetical protein